VGSEGTLGVVTQATVRLLRAPHAVQTLLAAFSTIEAAGDAVSAIIAAGVLPAAIEMMDALAIEAAEAAVHPDYPADAGAVLIVELDGASCEVDAHLGDVERLCREAGAFELRIAQDEIERALIWKGRKSAFAAVGRISPDYIVQDGVIPRTALADVLHAIEEVAAEAGLRVANVFHAGDGNLHPLVLFDEAQGETERAEGVSDRIIELCLEHGGSITGEHGVGHDKVVHMGKMFSPVDLDVMQLVRCAFDPDGISNPGKIFPTPRLCGERPGRRSGVHPLSQAGIAEVF
jgi:glycolate oxidase